MTAAASFYVKVALPPGTGGETREALSELLTRVAARFSFQGLEDYQVTLGAGDAKVLGAEREFHDLRGRGRMSEELRVYFGQLPHAKAYAQILRASFAELKISAPRTLGKKDWMKEWRRHYRTQVIREGRRAIAIVPAWKKPPLRPAAHVKIWPGQAFGTGTHATTRLCLQAFLRALPELPAEVRLLDFGAGTGVLALGAAAAAAKEKKAVRALAVESDPEALEQARKNGRLNRQTLRYALRPRARERYDFVFANVLAPVLLQFRGKLVAALRPGALLVLSGILASEAKAFAKSFAGPELEFVGTAVEGDWAAITWRRAQR